jgi:hypothetical protein
MWHYVLPTHSSSQVEGFLYSQPSPRETQRLNINEKYVVKSTLQMTKGDYTDKDLRNTPLTLQRDSMEGDPFQLRLGFSQSTSVKIHSEYFYLIHC